jgi:hypothetical protein
MEIIIFGLATWRISSLIVNEEGPFHIFEKLREKTGIQHDPDGNIEIVPSNLFAGILSCVWCCSVWVGFGIWLLYTFFPTVALWIASALCLSAIAIIVNKFVNPT